MRADLNQCLFRNGYVKEREFVGLDPRKAKLWGTHYYGLTPAPWHFTAIMVRP
jgi:hypothetical protein